MISIEGYNIEKTIVTRPESITYTGIQLQTSRPVVLKYFSFDMIAPAEVTLIKRDYNNLKQLRSQYVVDVLDFQEITDERGSGFILIYEDFQGIPLTDYLFQMKINIKEFLEIAIQLSTGVNDLHKAGIIHKNLKSSIIALDPTKGLIKIKDFGLESIGFQKKHNLYDPEIVIGSLPYISPEQTGRMSYNIDSRSDFYSLGVIYYELLTGEPPFLSEDSMEIIHAHIARQPTSPSDKQAGIPLMISNIVMKLLVKSPEDRYQSAYGLRIDLENCRDQFTAKKQIESFPLGQKDIVTTWSIIPVISDSGLSVLPVSLLKLDA
ncbi:serine/threonine protein kinase [candidate division CSSED10-310 bacterium]|uniref:Serine/threonine protein kinase n=1 Tax=candidate division CSSED10-310 bacterium TaxID=2855610 RepID=A0ABV6Z735_UNCC1